MMNETASASNRATYLSMGFLALCFAVIVMKELELPAAFLVGASVVGGMGLFFAGVNNPHIITYVLVAYLPFSRTLVGDFAGLAMALNFTNILMGFIVVAWFTGRFSRTEPLWLSSPLNFPIGLFIVIGLISIVRGAYYGTGYFHMAIIEFKRWFTPIFLYFLVLNTVKDRRAVQRIIIIMMMVTTIVGLMAVYDYMTLGEVSSLEKARIGGIAGHSNSLAAFFNYYMFLPFGFFLMNMNRFKYWGFLIPFLICFRGVMVTFSRGGYLAFALGLYAIVFFRSKLLFILLCMVAVLALLNPVLIPAGIRYRMGQTFIRQTSYTEITAAPSEAEGSLESSARNRVEIWKASVEMIRDHAFFGIGYGLFPYMIRYYLPAAGGFDAHNTYLIVAAEMGLPALIVFLWIVFLAIWNTHHLYRTTRDPFAKAVALGFLGGLFGLLLSNMFGSRLDHQEVAGYFWILAALVMRLKILDQKGNTGAKAALEPAAAGRKRYTLDAGWVDY